MAAQGAESAQVPEGRGEIRAAAETEGERAAGRWARARAGEEKGADSLAVAAMAVRRVVVREEAALAAVWAGWRAAVARVVEERARAARAGGHDGGFDGGS